MLLYEIPFLVLIILIMDSPSIYVKKPKKLVFRCPCGHGTCSCAIYKGGYKLCLATYADIKDYILGNHCTNPDFESSDFKFVGHMHKSDAKKYQDHQYIHVLLPLHAHVKIVPLTECQKIANEHGILAHSQNPTIASMKMLFSKHECDKCSTHITVFEVVPSNKECKRTQREKAEDIKTSAEKDRSCEKTHERVKAHHL